MKRMLTALTLMLPVIVPPVCAQAAPPRSEVAMVTANDVAIIKKLMEKAGYKVTRETANDNTPRLSSEIGDTSFSVYFYGCEEKGVPCTSIQFESGYDLDTRMALIVVNRWNRENRFGRVVLDEDGDPFLRYDVNMPAPGISQTSFAGSLDLWKELLLDFEQTIDW